MTRHIGISVPHRKVEEDDDIQEYKKPWQPLNWGEVPEDKTKSEEFLHGARWAEKQLRDKNT